MTRCGVQGGGTAAHTGASLELGLHKFDIYCLLATLVGSNPLVVREVIPSRHALHAARVTIVLSGFAYCLVLLSRFSKRGS